MNALLILNRRRFLSKFGLDPTSTTHSPHNTSGGSVMSLKSQLVGLLHAVQYLKVPIIICNTITIVLEMLLGGT
jgi:immediate early response 3-interacting protein 1